MFPARSAFSSLGLTLVELIVVIAMLSVLFGMAIITLDPVEQIRKAQDSTRKHDLEEVRNAMDLYYNDTGCYPLSVPFGGEWKVGENVLMKKVPQDPSCKSGSCYGYFYLTDQNSSCPQWNVLYSTQKSKYYTKVANLQCQIRTMVAGKESICPTGPMSAKYTYCITSGEVDCSYVSGMTFPGLIVPTVGPTSAPGITSTPAPTVVPVTPTPTTHPVCGCQCLNPDGSQNAQYDIRAGLCNVVNDGNPGYCNDTCTIPCCP